MIKFLSKLPLFRAVYRQGGIDSFHLAHEDIRLTMRDDLDKQAEELVKDKLSKLLSVVDQRQIVTFSERMKAVFIGGIQATPEELVSLKAEAEMLSQLRLWQLLYETPKELAQRAMFMAGESIDDMKKGRAILYTLDTQRRIIDTLKSYQPATDVGGQKK